MTSPDRDQLTAYALGILPPEEEARVRAALDADPALRAQVDADQEALVALAEALPQEPVPGGAEERLMARLVRERPEPAAPVVSAAPPVTRRRPNRTWLPLAALGLAAALALVLVLRPEGDPLRRYASTPGATTQPLEANGNRLGQLVRLPDGRAYVYLAQPAEAGRIYQMWQIQGGVPVSLGLFEGQGFLLTGLATGATVAVSVEPPGGSPQPTTTPILVQTL
ncbi:anti-sigma E factor [Deinococcus aetherius]|uniref:Regulator of SigK n=1 Tax=Deinococcus aetherius TaxID=200252 RepID=A0ABM8AAT7_9DEIO|nr:anti-sigma factor [Deinococcus aetherius]BDP40851.1 anti-sigma E factor [Deinococcus aetherius]